MTKTGYRLKSASNLAVKGRAVHYSQRATSLQTCNKLILAISKGMKICAQVAGGQSMSRKNKRTSKKEGRERAVSLRKKQIDIPEGGVARAQSWHFASLTECLRHGVNGVYNEGGSGLR